MVAETPQVVVDRMFKRVITFAGLPVLTGMMLFPLFWYLRVSVQDWLHWVRVEWVSRWLVRLTGWLMGHQARLHTAVG